MTRTCTVCREPLKTTARAHARYCSDKCRMRDKKAGHKQIPKALKARDRWVNVAKHSKRPITAAGRPASVSDPGTWGPYSEAAKAASGRPTGFVLDTSDDIACVDLDKCINPDGALTAAAEAVLEAAGDTFVEVSMSGRGLHVWGRATVIRGRRFTLGEQSVEVYGQGRYIAVTGKAFRGSRPQLGNIQNLIDSILK